MYVSSTKRAQQTTGPLARRLKLTPKIYDRRDTPGLIAAVSVETGTVLIVGHSNTVPEIIEENWAASAPLTSRMMISATFGTSRARKGRRRRVHISI